jgi:hypothetical protein
MHDYPKGLYRDTCRNIHTDRDDLIAECRTWDGEWHRTTLENYGRCGNIINDKGRLRCGEAYGEGSGQGGNWQPKGSYQESCRNVRFVRGDLQAECQTRFGWKSSTLEDARSCRGDIANDHGRLVCVSGGRHGRITLYRDARFRGERREYSGDTPELGPFADRASSAEVHGGSWQLCTRRSFRGRCVTINDSVNDFTDIGLNDRVESIRRLR